MHWLAALLENARKTARGHCLLVRQHGLDDSHPSRCRTNLELSLAREGPCPFNSQSRYYCRYYVCSLRCFPSLGLEIVGRDDGSREKMNGKAVQMGQTGALNFPAPRQELGWSSASGSWFQHRQPKLDTDFANRERRLDGIRLEPFFFFFFFFFFFLSLSCPRQHLREDLDLDGCLWPRTERHLGEIARFDFSC
jgi:hypothetical protein